MGIPRLVLSTRMRFLPHQSSVNDEYSTLFNAYGFLDNVRYKRRDKL